MQYLDKSSSEEAGAIYYISNKNLWNRATLTWFSFLFPLYNLLVFFELLICDCIKWILGIWCLVDHGIVLESSLNYSLRCSSHQDHLIPCCRDVCILRVTTKFYVTRKASFLIYYCHRVVLYSLCRTSVQEQATAAVTLAYTTRVFVFGSQKISKPCHIKQM